MNARAAVKQVSKKKPPTRPRAGHGQWVEPAAAVFELVSKQKWNVSDAVREVVGQFEFKDPEHAFNGVRAAYYVMRKAKEDFEI